MFDGSGLTYEFINDRTVAVRPCRRCLRLRYHRETETRPAAG